MREGITINVTEASAPSWTALRSMLDGTYVTVVRDNGDLFGGRVDGSVTEDGPDHEVLSVSGELIGFDTIITIST